MGTAVGACGSQARTVEETSIAGAGPVRFEATVPRRLVHRRAVAEVLLTDWRSAGAGRYVCGAQLPRAHGFYRPCAGQVDSVLFAEALRQAGTLLAHVAYNVDDDVSFVMRRLAFAITGDTGIGEELCELELAVTVEDVARSATRLRGFSIEVGFRRAGMLVAFGSGTVRFIPPGVYPRLRWGSGPPRTLGPPVCPPPLAPELVGAHDPGNVVLGDPQEPGGWPLRVCPEHPVFFDHPLDHVPGMLILEALRQAGRARIAWPAAQVMACEATFERYVELDVPCLLSSELLEQGDETARLVVTACQGGSRAVRAELRLSRTAASR